jgi:hypothetical protein
VITVRNVPGWRGTIPLLMLLPACLTGAEEDHPQDSRASQAALQGSSTFTRHPDQPCPDDIVTDLDMLMFERAVQEAARVGRTVATSEAMKDCLSQVMTVGNIKFPAPHSSLPWGPYEPNDAPTDPFNSGVLQAANLHTRRATHMVNVWNHTKSILDIKGHCWNAGGTGASQGPRIHTSWFKPEVMNWRQATVVSAVIEWNAGGTRRRDVANSLAATAWHEAMHTHGYEHDGTEANHVRKVPHIVGVCMADILTKSFANCSQTCATGELNTVSSFNGTGCTCVADPAAPQVASSTVTQPGSATRLTVDSWGRAYMLSSGTVFRHPIDVANYGTVPGKTISDIFAGGLQIYALTTDGGLYRGLGGAWETIQSSGVLQVAVDDFGTPYYRTASNVMVKRLGSAAPVSIRSSAATSIVAGGDRVYATIPGNGDIQMYDHEHNTWFLAGSAGAQFAVDSHGVLHGLSPDMQLVVRNERDEHGNHWNNVGGAAASITAGNHLFARNSGGSVYERYPNGKWELVTSGGARVQERGGGIWGILNGSIIRFQR